MALAAFPADGTARARAPSSTARDTATAIPRALKLPVGFSPSSLTNSRLQPSARPRRGAGRRGVHPSPSVTMYAGARTGRSSRYRQRLATRPTRSAGRTAARARPRSYRASRTFPQDGQMDCWRSASTVNPQAEHSRWLRKLILLSSQPRPALLDKPGNLSVFSLRERITGMEIALELGCQEAAQEDE